MQVVIIGAGQAGCEIATALRQRSPGCRIILLGDEAHLPYHRPPLSKGFLTGKVAAESLAIKPREVYEKLNVECHFGTAVTGVAPGSRTVLLAGGGVFEYDKLAFATGGRVRQLSLPGAGLPGVHCVRSLDDSLRLRPCLQPGRRMVIIGGGFIGLEIAAICATLGLKVTVIESTSRVLARVCAPQISSFYERYHRGRGVDIRTGCAVAGFEGRSSVEYAVLENGERLATDLVVVGIGLIPNSELAAAAGLATDGGILVDSYARTSDPDIVAAGDCANSEHGFLGRRLRIESVQNAVEQARVAAASIIGQPSVHSTVPWFWSDQYDLKLQMIGVSHGHDQLILRGDPARDSFSAFYLRQETLLAVDTINRPADFVVGKRLVSERARPDPAKLADEAVALKSLLAVR